MAGNKSAYTDALRKGHNLAWEGRHDAAAMEYRRALAEFPDDLAANSSLGSACLAMKLLPEALVAYHVMLRRSPGDILSLTRAANIQGMLGKRDEADAAFGVLVQALVAASMTDRILEARQQAVGLMPDHVASRERLAEALGSAGRQAEASAESLTVARIHQQASRFPEAIESLERALLYDATNAEAASLLGALRGTTSPGVADDSPSEVLARESQERLARSVMAEQPAGPAADPDQRRVEALIGQALNYQARGEIGQAIAAYQQVLAAGVSRSEVEYNLGVLYQQSGRYNEAIQHLGRTAELPDYAVGSHVAIGNCYKSQGDTTRAMEHYLAAAGAVDTASMQREQADDVIALYRSLAEGYKMKGQTEKSFDVVTSLVNLLSAKGWEDKASLVRPDLESMRASGPDQQDAEAEANIPEWKLVAQKLSAFDEYLAEQHFTAAIEECHDIINLAPGYLPVHYRLGTVYTQQGRPEQAAEKYLTLATLHGVRNETGHALEACRLAVSAAPQDSRARQRLAAMYLTLGQNDKALEELDVLGDLQLQRGQKEEARATIRKIISLEPPDVEGYQQLLSQLETQG
jgi:tetratricopeptide (TPR) repeat protein